MKTLEIGKHKIEQYDSIEDLPMARYQKFNKFLLIDAGLGSDVEHFAEHANRIAAFIRQDKKEDALKEVRNLTQCVQLVASEISPAFLAFAALIKSIDGEPFDDLSEAGLTRITEVISDIPAGVMFAKLAELKKKLETELMLYFPHIFESSETKEYYSLLKSKALISLEQLERKDLNYRQKELEAIDDKIITFSSPMTFTGSNSFEIRSDKQYQDGCLVIASNMNIDTSKLTVLSYYNALDFIQDKQKKQKKNGGKKH